VRVTDLALPNVRIPLNETNRVELSPVRHDLGVARLRDEVVVRRRPGITFCRYPAAALVDPVWSPAQTHLAWVQRSGGGERLVVYDAAHSPGALLHNRELVNRDAKQLAWCTADPNLLAVVSEEAVECVDLNGLQSVCSWNPGVVPRAYLAWCTTQPWLAIPLAQEVHVMNLTNGRWDTVAILPAQVYSAAHMAWQPNTQRFAVCDHNVLKIWDVGKCESPIVEHRLEEGYSGCALDTVAWSPKRDLIAVLRERQLRVWRLRDDTLELVRDIHFAHNFQGHKTRVQWHPTKLDTVEIVGGYGAWSTSVTVTYEGALDRGY